MSPELTYLLQTIIWNCGQHIQPFFKGGKDDGNWRNLDIFYKSGDDCIAMAPGQVTFQCLPSPLIGQNGDTVTDTGAKFPGLALLPDVNLYFLTFPFPPFFTNLFLF
jgi:hypothetical protein